MQSHAEHMAIESNDIFAATVKTVLDKRYLLTAPDGHIVRAQQAASCLVAPAAGDAVLAYRADGRSYVLAILTRPDRAPLALSFEGDVALTTEAGRIDISATGGVTLSTEKDLHLISDRLTMASQALVSAFAKLDILGGAVDVRLEEIKLCSKKLTSRIGSAIQHFANRHAEVAGLDLVRAGTIKRSARELMIFRSAFAFMKAKKNVKIDAKQIFMG